MSVRQAGAPIWPLFEAMDDSIFLIIPTLQGNQVPPPHTHTHTSLYIYIQTQVELLLPNLEKGAKTFTHDTCLPRAYVVTCLSSPFDLRDVKKNEEEHFGENCGKI